MTNSADIIVLPPAESVSPQAEHIVLPLQHETLTVSRRKFDTAVVKVSTVTHEREAHVDETLTHQRVEVARIPVGRTVDAVPPVREDGDTTIIPVVEEVIVIEKRLVLKEEIHLRRVQVAEKHQETVILREQDAVITRIKVDADRFSHAPAFAPAPGELSVTPATTEG